MKFRPPYPSASDRWGQLRRRLARAGFSLQAEPFDAARAGERTETCQHDTAVGERCWRCDPKGLNELQIRQVAGVRAVGTGTIGPVVILGLEQLEPALTARRALDEASKLQLVDQVQNVALGTDAESVTDLAIRWAEAMIAEMGAEEYQAFLRAWCQAAHGEPPT